MTIWEYDHLHIRLSNEASNELLPKTLAALKEKGALGWEVIQLIQDGLTYSAWLKRPVEAQKLLVEGVDPQ